MRSSNTISKGFFSNDKNLKHTLVEEDLEMQGDDLFIRLGEEKVDQEEDFMYFRKDKN
jgi:hypothetical protein